MRLISNFTLFLISLMMISCSDNKQTADYIVTNARIYTVDDSMSVAEAFAVRDGKFVAAGSEDHVMSRFKADSVIRLDGKFVYPGFIDPHCHFYGYGTVLQQADLNGVKSEREMLGRVQDFVDKHPAAEWIKGCGWDHTMWKNNKMPDRKQLDKIFPDKPVVLKRVDGHAVLANAKAIKLAGMDSGRSSEHPKGIFLDNEAQKILDQVPDLNRRQNIRALLDAQRDCFKVGLTSVHDAGLDRDLIELINSLQQDSSLKMRIYAMLNPTKQNFELMENGFINTGYLHVRSLKLYADGALGSRGAKLIHPYSDKNSTNGLLVMQPDTIRKYCRRAAELNYQVNTHAIGDSAVRLVLDIYRDFVEDKNDHRWRIEHSQIVHPDDLDRFGKLEVIPSVQTTHATSDMDWAADRLGEKRVKNAYCYKDLLKQNDWLPNGSDFPVEDINPLYGFYAAIARKDRNGKPENGFMPQQALNREEALKAMTIWAAKAAFEEDEKGSIEKGKMADFVVLDRDIMKVPENEIHKANVLKTFLDGEIVFDRNDE